MPLSHQRGSRSSSVLELFWFGTGFYFQPPFCSHRPEPDWCCRCCVMTSPFTSLIFSPTALTTTTMGDCVGSMIVLLLIIRSQINGGVNRKKLCFPGSSSEPALDPRWCERGNRQQSIVDSKWASESVLSVSEPLSVTGRSPSLLFISRLEIPSISVCGSEVIW